MPSIDISFPPGRLHLVCVLCLDHAPHCHRPVGELWRQVLVTRHAAQGEGSYYDPASKQTFNFDHLRKVTSDIAEGDGGDGPEAFRVAFETAARQYAKEHYPAGITAVYGKGSHVIVCIEDHKFQPHNFWNGRWRSEWDFNTVSASLCCLSSYCPRPCQP